MLSIGQTVKMKRGGICSKHKGQEGTIIRINGSGPRASYFVQYSDQKVEVHRIKAFDNPA